MHLHSGFLLVHSGFFDSTLRHNVDTIMTLDAAKWNCAGGDLSSCVTNIIILDHVSYYSEHFWKIYQLTFYPFLFYVLIMFMFLMYCGLHA